MDSGLDILRNILWIEDSGNRKSFLATELGAPLKKSSLTAVMAQTQYNLKNNIKFRPLALFATLL
jgi:hypothetical protein